MEYLNLEIRRHNFAIADEHNAAPVVGRHAVANKANRAVAKSAVESAWVRAAESNRPERRAAAGMAIVGFWDCFAEANVILIPSGVVPHFVVAAGRPRDVAVQLFLGNEKRV